MQGQDVKVAWPVDLSHMAPEDAAEWVVARYGELRPVKGALAMALALRAARLSRELLLPRGCADEAALVQGRVVKEAGHPLDLVNALQPRTDTPLPCVQREPPPRIDNGIDLRDIKKRS